MSEKVKILKVRFDKVTLNEAAEIAMNWLKEGKKRYITTPNPEILLEAQKSWKYRRVLNKSDLNIADGTGILWASRYLADDKKRLAISLMSIVLWPRYIKKILPQRVTGSDLMLEICKRAVIEDYKIFLLGAGHDVAKIAKEKLEKKYSGIKIVGTYEGTPSKDEEKTIRTKIDNSGADILFVAYGAPKQELWIRRNLKKLETVKLAIGVGGAFDFIAETKKRAPLFMRKTGTEWLFRLIQQPSRIKRIYNAVIKFPLTIISK